VSNNGDSGDLAVIVFSAPIPGVTPASLPTENVLEGRGRERLTRESFDLVAYGVSRYAGGSNGSGGRRPDFASTGTRKVARETFASLSPGWLRLRTNGDAGVCNGDSGSASLFGGSNVVAGITALEWSLSGGQCESSPWDQRVDTPSARAFLGQYLALP
jgi:hypothetical protein